jgi:light-regulated signal transduction histidine kinase (bacteriophytochrome)
MGSAGLPDPEVQLLRKRVSELEHEKAQLEQFAAMAAHELVKPLVMTGACATAIRERTGHGLDFASRRDLESVIRIAARMRQLVETLLIDSRDGDGALVFEPVDLAAVMQECLASLAADIEAREASVEVDPLPVVRGNAVLLSGVFGNLLSNALKYAPAAGSQIQVTAVRADGCWVIAVESPGPAIPERERQSIFEPWKRGENSGRVPGNGMGLALVRRVVERHGGQVGIMAAGEAANRFFFTLPA